MCFHFSQETPRSGTAALWDNLTFSNCQFNYLIGNDNIIDNSYFTNITVKDNSTIKGLIATGSTEKINVHFMDVLIKNSTITEIVFNSATYNPSSCTSFILDNWNIVDCTFNSTGAYMGLFNYNVVVNIICMISFL